MRVVLVATVVVVVIGAAVVLLTTGIMLLDPIVLIVVLVVVLDGRAGRPAVVTGNKSKNVSLKPIAKRSDNTSKTYSYPNLRACSRL